MKYDVVVVVDPSLEAQATQDRFTTLLEKEGFTVSEVVNLGKKRLAYPIKKKTEGLYFHFSLVGAGAAPKSIYTKFRLDDSILRTLILKKEEGKKKSKLRTQIPKN